MAKVLVSDTNLSNIADAIRSKNGTTKSYKVTEMATAIEGISVGDGASEDLSSELSTQNSLITTQETTIDNIISALEGKASSGGSATPDTCTISMDFSGSDIAAIAQYAFATFENNKVTTTSFITNGTNNNKQTLVVNNVICGSDFKVSYGNWLSWYANELISNNISNLETNETYCYISGKAPTTAGATGTIIIKNASGGDDDFPEPL